MFPVSKDRPANMAPRIVPRLDPGRCNAGHLPAKVPLQQMSNGQAAASPGGDTGIHETAVPPPDAKGFSKQFVRNFAYLVEYELWPLPKASPAFTALLSLTGGDLGRVSFHRTRGIEPPDDCSAPYAIMRRNPKDAGYALMCVQEQSGRYRVVEANFNAAELPRLAALVSKAP